VGGAEYIGEAVNDLLVQREHNAHVYDALFYEESYRKALDFIYGDVRDTDRLLPHLKWADASKAKMGWEPRVTFKELVRIIVDADMEALYRASICLISYLWFL